MEVEEGGYREKEGYVRREEKAEIGGQNGKKKRSRMRTRTELTYFLLSFRSQCSARG